jgi:hypothetical protein
LHARARSAREVLARSEWRAARVFGTGRMCTVVDVGTLESPDCVVIKNNRITEKGTRRFRLVRDLCPDLTPNQGAIPGFAARLMQTPTCLLPPDLSDSGSQLFPDLSGDGRELFLDWSGDGNRLFLDLCRRREPAGARRSDHSSEQGCQVKTRGGRCGVETSRSGRTVGERQEGRGWTEGCLHPAVLWRSRSNQVQSSRNAAKAGSSRR